MQIRPFAEANAASFLSSAAIFSAVIDGQLLPLDPGTCPPCGCFSATDLTSDQNDTKLETADKLAAEYKVGKATIKLGPPQSSFNRFSAATFTICCAAFLSYFGIFLESIPGRLFRKSASLPWQRIPLRTSNLLLFPRPLISRGSRCQSVTSKTIFQVLQVARTTVYNPQDSHPGIKHFYR